MSKTPSPPGLLKQFFQSVIPPEVAEAVHQQCEAQETHEKHRASEGIQNQNQAEHGYHNAHGQKVFPTIIQFPKVQCLIDRHQTDPMM